jgi:hypothetical protein
VISQPVIAQGGCISGPLEQYLEHAGVVAIFRGAVTAVKPVPDSLTFPRDHREIATMTVTRVWKGTVASTTALHRWFAEGRFSGGGFEAGKEYVAIAHELSPESRPWFGLPWTGERALGVNGWGACSVMPADSPAALRLIGAAPGYPPTP